MTYVDGFVLNIKKKNIEKYRKMAKDAGMIWKKFGALQYFECIGDDMNSAKKHGCLTFPKISKTKSDEVVFFSFIIYKSKAHRDSVNKKVMKYFNEKYSKKEQQKDMPFDMKKMAYGGFKPIVEY